MVTVYNGEKAIEAVDSDPDIALILMDIDLGKGIDGTKAAEKILERHDIPVVFLSSHTEPEIVERTEGITSYGYIVKNSGETVILASMRMAFRLYDAHIKYKTQKERYEQLFTNISSGVSVYQATENGDDFIFVDFNKTAEKS
ncbi:MAG: response regulator [Spirochaetia bacterium]|nr:response regulator [Spirochaetia bacterium]